MRKPSYIPTPDEIQKRARAIRKSWSDAERRRRLNRAERVERPHWLPPIISASQFLESLDWTH